MRDIKPWWTIKQGFSWFVDNIYTAHVSTDYKFSRMWRCDWNPYSGGLPMLYSGRDCFCLNDIVQSGPIKNRLWGRLWLAVHRGLMTCTMAPYDSHRAAVTQVSSESGWIHQEWWVYERGPKGCYCWRVSIWLDYPEAQEKGWAESFFPKNTMYSTWKKLLVNL